MRLFKLLSIILLSTTLNAQNNFPYKLTKVFETSGFDRPESVIRDTKNKLIFVSNQDGGMTEKNGTGYISKLKLNGEIIEKKWITGINGPKGMAIYKNILYVSDIDVIVAINIKTKEVKRYPVQGTKHLNDVTVDKRGNVYVSEILASHKIYMLSKGNVSVFIQNKEIENPNGLYAYKGNLYVGTSGSKKDPVTYESKIPGSLFKINLKNKTITKITKPFAGIDGVEKAKNGFFMSDWLKGKIYYYSKKTKQISEALNLSRGTADIDYDRKSKMLYIPMMIEGKVLAYKMCK